MGSSPVTSTSKETEKMSPFFNCIFTNILCDGTRPVLNRAAVFVANVTSVLCEYFDHYDDSLLSHIKNGDNYGLLFFMFPYASSSFVFVTG